RPRRSRTGGHRAAHSTNSLTEPGQIPDSPWKKYDVVSVSVFAFSAGMWCRRLYLSPSRDWSSGGGWPDADTNTSVWGCNGRDAYPGGWPGDGGDGGSFTLITENLANGIESLRDAGAMGDPTLPLWGDVVKQRTVHVL